MVEYSSQQYDDDEVGRIIRRALKLKRAHGISYQDLIETAKEIGIDSQTVKTAIEQERREFKNRKIRETRSKRRKVGFYSHLWIYIIINAALLMINNFTPGPWWFQWSVLGWGIGLAFHFKAIYFPHNAACNKRLHLYRFPFLCSEIRNGGISGCNKKTFV